MSKGAKRADRTFWFVMVDGRPRIEDPKSWALFESLKNGSWYAATVKADRSLGKLGHWWAGLQWMIDRWQHEGDRRGQVFITSRKLHDAALKMLGYTTEVYDLDGNVVGIEADSISFEAMSEAEFLEMFERARVMAFKYWGIDPWAEWQAEKQAEKEIGDHAGG